MAFWGGRRPPKVNMCHLFGGGNVAAEAAPTLSESCGNNWSAKQPVADLKRQMLSGRQCLLLCGNGLMRAKGHIDWMTSRDGTAIGGRWCLTQFALPTVSSLLVTRRPTSTIPEGRGGCCCPSLKIAASCIHHPMVARTSAF